MQPAVIAKREFGPQFLERGQMHGRFALEHPADGQAGRLPRETAGFGVEGNHHASIQHAGERRDRALDAILPPMVYKTGALEFDECPGLGYFRHQRRNRREPRQARAGMTRAKALRLAGIDAVELARHHQAQVAGRAGGPVEARIVNHVRNAVSGQLHVEFRVPQAETPGSLESRQRILGKVFRIAAVCDDFWRVGPGGGWRQHRSAGLAGL